MNSGDKRRRDQGFATKKSHQAFVRAYDAVLAQWPDDVTSVNVDTDQGRTHVQVCGREDGPPVVLLHGGGATSTVWFANAAALGRTHRVYAPDQPGSPGLSVDDGRPMRSVQDLNAWLDQLLDGLRLSEVALVGHSYGGWLALNYALHAPLRTTQLVLLDPTDCFAGLRASYRLRAVPLFVRPTANRMDTFLNWETSRSKPDPTWKRLMALGAEYRGSRLVLPRRPADDALKGLRLPTLMLLAANSRAHDIRLVERNARRLLCNLDTAVLAGASHHSIPTEPIEQLNWELSEFLA